MPLPLIDSETAEPQTLDEVLDWHRGIVNALVGQRAHVQRAIDTGSAVAQRFVGMTEAEVNAYYDVQRRELDRLTVLNLVGSAEASLKIDFFRRVRQRLNDPLARAYQAWHKGLAPRKQLRPDFDEGGILDVLKKAQVMDNHVVGRYRECLQVRHWIGHGRYWIRPAAVNQLDPDDVYDRASILLRAMPA